MDRDYVRAQARVARGTRRRGAARPPTVRLYTRQHPHARPRGPYPLPAFFTTSAGDTGTAAARPWNKVAVLPRAGGIGVHTADVIYGSEANDSDVFRVWLGIYVRTERSRRGPTSRTTAMPPTSITPWSAGSSTRGRRVPPPFMVPKDGGSPGGGGRFVAAVVRASHEIDVPRSGADDLRSQRRTHPPRGRDCSK
jgi:hypothetical protein